jgi:hypothetical protein
MSNVKQSAVKFNGIHFTQSATHHQFVREKITLRQSSMTIFAPKQFRNHSKYHHVAKIYVCDESQID